MAFSNLPLALMSVVALAMARSIQAQNSPEDFLAAHNAARAQVGVGPMTWDTDLEAYASLYADVRSDDCRLKHTKWPYGENLFWSLYEPANAADAVNAWVDEKNDYNYDNNKCDAGKVCAHYTQVVWSNSVRLGCARAKCKNGSIFITCNYDPRGNEVGQSPYPNSNSTVSAVFVIRLLSLSN